MRRIIRAIASVMLATLALGAGAASARPAQTATPEHWIVVDAGSGVVLFAGDAHTPAYAASAVKVMTALTALERLPVDGTLTVSPTAAEAPPETLGMAAGETWPVDAALKGMLLTGANDAAYALAEAVGGDLAGFADAMTATGERIGLRDSEFHDPTGLDDADAFEGGSMMSAYDLAVVARNALAVPELAQTLALPEYELTTPDGRTQILTNTLELLATYDGATGQKSGFTTQAGSVIVASATRGERTIIAVGLDVSEPTTWATNALDDGFATPPDAIGTGEQLPEVDVASASANTRALAGLPLALGRPALTVGEAGSGEGGGDPSVADDPEPDDSGGLPLPVSLLILGTLLAGAVYLVRRMVMAYWERRQYEEAAAFPDAQRRGWLHVVERGDLQEPRAHVRPVGLSRRERRERRERERRAR